MMRNRSESRSSSGIARTEPPLRGRRRGWSRLSSTAGTILVPMLCASVLAGLLYEDAGREREEERSRRNVVADLRVPIIASALSPDGSRVGWVGENGAVGLHVLHGPEEEGWTFEGTGPGATASCVAFSPDGILLASTGSRDGIVYIRQVAGGEVVRTILAGKESIHGLAFSPDGRLLATGGSDAVIKLWSVADGARAATLGGHKGGICRVAFSPDGRSLASTSTEGIVAWWEFEQSRAEVPAGAMRSLQPPDEPLEWPVAVAFSPDGTRLATGNVSSQLMIRDPVRGTIEARLGSGGQAAYSVAFSPDGRWVAGADLNGGITVWDTWTAEKFATLEGHRGMVSAVAFLPDGRRLASSGRDGTIRLWPIPAP